MDKKSTLDTILESIQKFVASSPYNGQVNLDSIYAQESLANHIYDRLMKRCDKPDSYTVNDQQMDLFSNIGE